MKEYVVKISRRDNETTPTDTLIFEICIPNAANIQECLLQMAAVFRISTPEKVAELILKAAERDGFERVNK